MNFEYIKTIQYRIQQNSEHPYHVGTYISTTQILL